MTAQPDLFTGPTSAHLSAPAATPAPPLVRLLKGAGWRTARQLTEAMGFPNSESGRRLLREAAAESKGQVAGGQKGYKLTIELTDEEFHHACNWMNSQAAEMTARVRDMMLARNNK